MHGIGVVDGHGFRDRLSDGVCVDHCNGHHNRHAEPDIDADGIRVLQQIRDGELVLVEQPVASLVQNAVSHADPFRYYVPSAPECRGLCGDRQRAS